MAAAEKLEDRIRRMTPVSVSAEQRARALDLFDFLERESRRSSKKRSAPGYRLIGPGGEERVLPESVFYFLERVTEILARGDAVTIVPVGKELTTQQAADLLHVSRQYLVRLLDEGRLPYTKTGKHRRLRIDDVLAFKEQREKDRGESLRELTRLTEELGGYDRER